MLLVLVCFFLSGLTGLIYQVLWTKMIIKIIGSSPFAVSIILTVFMSGLGIGSFLAGRIIDRTANASKLVQVYGLLELAVSAYAMAIPLLINLMRPLYAIIYNQLFHHFVLYNLITFVGCFVLLSIPVICMGATLPVLCRFYVTSLSSLGTHTGRLYGLNTIGAAFGAFICGFWLINILGIWGSLTCAVVINATIGVVCLFAGLLIKSLPTAAQSKPISSGNTAAENIGPSLETSQPPLAAKAAIVIFAVSGFCAMSYEVIWTRLIGLIAAPTTYSFTIVLVSFITGLALGSMLFGFLADRVKNPLWLLFGSQIAAALLALLVSQLLGNSQIFFAKLIYVSQADFVLMSALKAAVLFAFIIPPTICLGATFPLVGKIYTRSLASIGKSIGSIYAVNTIGAVLGSFCAGFVLIPLLGKEKSLSLIIGIQLCTSLIFAAVLARDKMNVQKAISLVLAFAGLLLCFYLPQWNRFLLAGGKYHRFEEIQTYLQSGGWLDTLLRGSKVQSWLKHKELVYYGDGIGGFTTVFKGADPFGNTEFTLANSGKVDASSRGDMPTQTLLAHFPMLFHKNPRTVMVLGLASGITAGEVLYYPIERLDVIDISRQVVQASSCFRPWNNDVLANPNTNLIIQDGRAHLNLTNQKYDVIISEPSNPWMAGLADLFTRDFFTQVRDRLNPDGIFNQWLHSYQMNWSTFALICRTFADVFPNNLLVWTDYSKTSGDFMLIGFNGSGKLSLDNTMQKIPCISQSKNVKLTDPKILYPLILSEDIKKLVGDGPINTDNHPRLEFDAPKAMYSDDPAIYESVESKKFISDETKNIIDQVLPDVNSQIDITAYLFSLYTPFLKMVDLDKATPAQKERFFSLVENYSANNVIDFTAVKDDQLRHRCLNIQIESLKNRLDRVPDKSVTYFQLAILYGENGLSNEAVLNYRNALESNPDLVEAHTNLGVLLMRQGKADEAAAHHRQAIKLHPYNANAYSNLAYALSYQSHFEQAVENFEKALRINPDFVDAHYGLGITLSELGQHSLAAAHFRETIRINPDYAMAHYSLGLEFVRYNMLDNAIACFKNAISLRPNLPDAHYNLAVALASKGSVEAAIEQFRQTLQVAPNHASAHNELGILLVPKGRLDEAIEHFNQALRIDPDFAQARQNLNAVLAAKNQAQQPEPGPRK